MLKPPTRTHRTNAPTAPLPDACPRCRWTGRLFLTWRRRAPVAGGGTIPVDDVVPAACACPRGATFAASHGTVEPVRDRLLANPATIEVLIGERRVAPAAISPALFPREATADTKDTQRAAANDRDDEPI